MLRCSTVARASVVVLCALGLVAQAHATVTSGTYTGSGAAGRQILGLGFQPEMVIIKGDNDRAAVIRTSTMPAGKVKRLAGDDALLPDRIRNLLADGFELGNDDDVNDSGVVYAWVAFSASQGELKLGTYRGNGNILQTITGVGFQPEAVFILPGDSDRPCWRSNAMATYMAMPFDASSLRMGLINSFQPDGFQVSFDGAVNENGVTFHYVAWNAASDAFVAGTYTGNGQSSQAISGIGFKPEWVLVKSGEGLAAAIKPRGLAAPRSGFVTAEPFISEGIQDLLGYGFRVGHDYRVNENNRTYYYLAFDDRAPDGADIALALAADSLLPDELQPVAYTLTALNQGPSGANVLQVNATIPAELEVVGAAPGAGSFDAATGVWNVGSLAVDESAVLTVTARPRTGTAGQTLRVSAAVANVSPPDQVAANDAASVDVVVAASDLALRLDVDDLSPDEGQDLIWTVTLANAGPQANTGVAVTVALPAGLTPAGHTASVGTYDDATGIWSVGGLAVLENVTLQLVTTVAAGTAGQDLTVDVAADGDRGDPTSFNDTAHQAVRVTSADLALALAADNVAPNQGDPVTFVVTLTNHGPDAATGIVVATVLPAELTLEGATPAIGAYDDATGRWSVPSLAAGASTTLTLATTVASAIGGENLLTTATVVGATQGDPVPANDVASVAIGVASADVDLTAIVSDATPDEGEGIDYVLTLANAGPDAASGITVAVAVPAGIAIGGHAASLGTYNGVTGQWSLGGLGAGASATLTLMGTPRVGTAGTTLVLNAAVTACDQADATPDDNVVTVPVTVTAVDLRLALSADDLHPDVDQQVPLYVAAANGGPDDATGVVVRVDLPDGLTYVGSDGAFDPDLGTWQVRDLVAGETATLIITAAVAHDAGGARLETAATVAEMDQGDPTPGNDSAALSMSVTSSDVGVTASFAALEAPAGGAVRLTVALACAGPDTATALTAQLTLPSPLTVAAFDAGAGLFDPATGRWQLAALAPGAAETLAVDCAVGAAPTGTVVTAEAAVTGLTQADPAPANGVASADLTVTAAPELRVVLDPFAETRRRLHPGGEEAAVLCFDVVNVGPVATSLRSIVVSGPPDQDDAWAGLALRHDGLTVGGAQGAFANGSLTFANLGLAVAPGDTLHLAVWGRASLDAPDGIELTPRLDGAGALVVGDGFTVSGAWPLVANGTLAVDGMTAAQLTLHPVGAEVFQLGSVRNLAFDVTVPANGTQPDVLTRFNVRNHGTAVAGSVLTRVELWADDGDGRFNAAADTRLAPLTWTGDRWEATGLQRAVPVDGLRVMVTVDIAPDVFGGTVMLGLPDGDDTGVGMASGNDGPIDRPVINDFAQTISATDRVVASAANLASAVVAPGQKNVVLLHLLARNLYGGAQTLDRLQVRNAGNAEAVAELTLRRDGNGDGRLGSVTEDPVLGTAIFTGDRATFAGLGWVLEPQMVAQAFLTADVSPTAAADGDTIGAVIGSGSDLEFAGHAALVGAWPLDSGARPRVDGMVAAQIVCTAVPPVSLTAGEGPVLALDLALPGNGPHADRLTQLQLVNTGSATTADIAQMQLWADDGDGHFQPASDVLVTDLAGIGANWVAPGLNLAIPAAGRRLFASLTVSGAPSDSATVQLTLPIDGATVASANDGPRDAAVSSPTSLLISTAPLLSTLEIAPTFSTVGQVVTVSMRVSNVSGEGVVGIVPQAPTFTGDAVLTVLAGPQPASLDLDTGAAGTFVWTVRAETPGQAQVRGACGGTGAVGGQPRHSLATTSAGHRVLNPAVPLEVYPVANLPFSVNRGQMGVVPLTFTLINRGDGTTADDRLTRIVISLDDGEGNPVAPAQLLQRVTLGEGVNVYCNVTDLPASGNTVALDLATPVVVTDREPATLSLRLDVLPETAVRRFRVQLTSAANIAVVDHVSGEPVTTVLSLGSYPVSSGIGNIVAPATGLAVALPAAAPVTAGPGQDQVELLRLELSGTGDPAFPTDVRVGAFAVSLVDTAGQRLREPWRHVQRLRVFGALSMHAEAVLASVNDTTVTFQLMPPLTIPVGESGAVLRVVGRVPDAAALGPVRLRLAAAESFDARDGNVGTAVPVNFVSAPIIGPPVTLQARAEAIAGSATPRLPANLTVGAAGVTALTLHLAHAAGDSTAAVVADTLRLICVDDLRRPLDPASVCDRLRVRWRGEPVADMPPPAAGDGTIRIPLNGVRLDAATGGDLDVVCDLEAITSAVAFELLWRDDGLVAHDANLQTPVVVHAAAGSDWPFTSGQARLVAPADELVVNVVDRMPSLLAGDGEMVEVARVVLQNGARAGAGDVLVAALTIRARDRALGEACTEVSAAVGDAVWATVTADSTAVLAGEAPLTIPAGQAVTVRISARFRADATGSLQLGLGADDLVVTQPDGAASAIRVRPAPGAAFPFWTLAGNFNGLDLETSYINFPNPFAAGREATSFAFQLPQAAEVSLQIFTARGEGVVTLLNGVALPTGLHQDVGWNGRNGRGETVTNGVYLAELRVRFADGRQERILRKVAVVR